MTAAVLTAALVLLIVGSGAVGLALFELEQRERRRNRTHVCDLPRKRAA